MSDEVMPCPHCGGESEMVLPPIYGDGYTFRCLTPDCINELGAGRLYRTEEQAVEAWNRRTLVNPHLSRYEVISDE